MIADQESTDPSLRCFGQRKLRSNPCPHQEYY